MEEFEAAIDAAAEKANVANQNPAGVEPAALAVKLAKEIVGSGTVVKAGQRVMCTLSGHANEGREPAPGWSKDTMYISVQQV